MAQYDVDLRDYWRIIKKRKATIVFMIVLVGVCSYGFAKLKEPVALYKAAAAIKIDRSANMASILTGEYWMQSENMVTHAYIIKSFPVLVQTAKSLGWLDKDLSAAAIRNSKKYLSVIKRLKAMLTAEPEEGTNIINVAAVSADPRQAAMVANACVRTYREYDIQEKNKRTFETQKFIEKQLQTTAASLKQAERKLQDFKEGFALISLDVQTQNTLNRLYAVETEYEKLKARKRAVASQLRSLQGGGQGAGGKFKTPLFFVPQDSPIYGLKEKLSQLLLKRQTLLINFTARHPRVKEVDDQIRAVRHEAVKELQTLLGTLETRGKALGAKLARLRTENLRLPEKGLQLVRLQREVDLQASLYSELKKKYQETLIQGSGKVQEVSIVKPAVAPDTPFNIPSKLMIVVTGVVMGLILGVVFAFLLEVFDTSMGTIEDVEGLLQVPVLGVIPHMDRGEKARGRSDRTAVGKSQTRDLVTHYEPKSMAAEAFRALRTNLQFLRLEMQGKVFLITSSFVQEGKTLNVVNLALSMAQAGNKVLLVDADLRKPLNHKVFGLSIEPGITDYVLGNYPWKEVANTISDVMLGDFGIDDILKTPGMDNLHIVTAGTKPPNPTDILSSSRFKQFLKEAKQDYAYIFIDAPPILPVADATEIAPLVDGVFLVYTVGKIGRGVLKRAKLTLDNVDAKVLGVILNNVKPEAGPEYFKYHSQQYYGTEDGKVPGKNGARKNWFQKFVKPLLTGKIFRYAAFILVMAMLVLEIFWQDLPGFSLAKWFSFL